MRIARFIRTITDMANDARKSCQGRGAEGNWPGRIGDNWIGSIGAAGVTIVTQLFHTFNSMNESPAIIFLGICERELAHVQDFYFNLHKWNIMGLKNVVLSNLYPLPLSGLSLGIAVLGNSIDVVHKLQIVDESGNEIGTIQLIFQAASPNSEPIAPCEPPTLLHTNRGCTVAFFAIDDIGMVIQKPGWCEVRLHTDQGLKTIGSLYFAVVDVEPLTPDRVAAIRSDPSTSKFVRLELSCKICSSKARAYAALDKDCTSEKEGWTWYQDLPDTFVCECGKTIDLAIARRNLHAYLRAIRQVGKPAKLPSPLRKELS